MGLMLAEPEFHTRCFVEWEEYPRSVLIAAQRAGYFAPAPIWDDLTTFDGRPFRGAFDTILAGYPCQPFSQAGQRKGADDERHLWPDVARVIREVEPEWVFLENVAGHVSLGAETVLRDLWDMGWTPAAGLFSASETGATHERLRWFCVAHRDRGDGNGCGIGRPGWGSEFADGSDRMAHSDGRNASAERQQRGGQFGFQPEGGRAGADDVVHAKHPERRSDATGRNITDGDDAGRNQAAGRVGKSDADVDNPASARCDDAWKWTSADSEGGECLPGTGCGSLGNSPRIGRGEGRAEHGVRIGRDTATGSGGTMADASEPRPEGREQRRSSDEWHGAAASGSTAEFRRACLFPPGPADMGRWAGVLADAPHLAPSLSISDVKRAADHFAQMVARGELAETQAQSFVRLCADGMANRSRSLRLLGNGVHPLTAAYAWRSLSSAHGLQHADGD